MRKLIWLTLILFISIACKTTDESAIESHPLPPNPTSISVADPDTLPDTPAPTATKRPSSPTPTATAIETATALATATPLAPTETATVTPSPGPTDTPTPTPLPSVRQIIQDNCCTGITWNDDSTEIRFIDQPVPDAPVGLWGVDVTHLGATPHLVTERLGVYNDDRSVVAYPDQDRELVIIERLADGEKWEIDTQGSRVSFAPDDRLLWTVFDDEVEFRSDQADVWLANPDGSDAQLLITLEEGAPALWFSDDELLITNRIPDSRDIKLSILTVSDGTLREFAQLPDVRSGVFSADRRYLIYMVRFEENFAENGLWLIDFQDKDVTPQRLPFFGSYRWRDNEHLIYVPLDVEATAHVFYEYDVVTGKSRRLTPDDPQTPELTIANNDWRVSPDGSKIALVAIKEAELDGVWVLEIGPTDVGPTN